MGYHINIEGPSSDVFRTLAAKPSELFPKPYAGYLLFLFADVDTTAERWFVDHARSLDALTGEDVAFAVVAHRTHYTVRSEPGRGGIMHDQRRLFECDVSDAPNATSVVPLVKSGRLGWVNDGDEIIARNNGAYALARELRITDKVPCVIAFDGVPSPNSPLIILPLQEMELSSLFKRIRIAIGELQKHPNFSDYTGRLHSAYEIARSIGRLDEKIANVRAKHERAAAAPAALQAMRTALRMGGRKRFDAALRGLQAVGVGGGVGPSVDDWKRLRTLHLTQRSLAFYAGAEWPLTSEQLGRLTAIRSEYVSRLLGGEESKLQKESLATLGQTIAELDAEQARMTDQIMEAFPTEAELRRQTSSEAQTLDDQRLVLEHRLLTENRAILEMSGCPSFCELLQRDVNPQEISVEDAGRRREPLPVGRPNTRASWLDWLPIRGLVSWLQSHNVLGLQVELRTNERLHCQRAPTAFASYASSDRPEVLRRVQGINAWQSGLDIFIDFHSLRSGDLWRDRLEEEIRRRDRFLLFWSRAASESKEVAFEWRFALNVHGLRAITPVPLQPPDEARPPRELEALHFNDSYLEYLRYARILDV